jgi:hypothetical protein
VESFKYRSERNRWAGENKTMKPIEEIKKCPYCKANVQVKIEQVVDDGYEPDGMNCQVQLLKVRIKQ